jgi:hypothetical protein
VTATVMCTDPFPELHRFAQESPGRIAAGRGGGERDHSPLTTYDTVQLAVLGVQSQRLSYRRHRLADFA